MSKRENVLGANIQKGKRPNVKTSQGQTSKRENVSGANVSGETGKGKTEKGKRDATFENALCVNRHLHKRLRDSVENVPRWNQNNNKAACALRFDGKK